MNLSRIKLVSLAFGASLIGIITGCDVQENADLANGRQVFGEKCARCHALNAASSKSDIGPDLDAAFAAVRAAGGFDEDFIEGVVEYQISTPRETAKDDPTYMPEDLVTGDEKRDVAAYIASVAGVPGIGPPEATAKDGAKVFALNGCGSCHVLDALGASAQGGTGPNLDQALAGQSAKEIRRSIVNPSADVSEGFPPAVMPSTYDRTISDADLQRLVEYLAETAGGGDGAGK